MPSFYFIARDGAPETVTQTDSSLLPAVIVLAVLTALLIGLLAIASFCYYRARKAGKSYSKARIFLLVDLRTLLL